MTVYGDLTARLDPFDYVLLAYLAGMATTGIIAHVLLFTGALAPRSEYTATTTVGTAILYIAVWALFALLLALLGEPGEEVSE